MSFHFILPYSTISIHLSGPLAPQLPRRHLKIRQKKFGHYASSSKKICNYCKKDEHIIKECPTRPPRQIAIAFTTLVDSFIPSSFLNRAPIQQNAPNVPTMTPGMVQ
ncbi:hypothetical protein CR513_31376, partial [Mucuna pruriens]